MLRKRGKYLPHDREYEARIRQGEYTSLVRKNQKTTTEGNVERRSEG